MKDLPLGIVLTEHRVGDARHERVRPLERCEQVEVDARRVDRFAQSFVEPLDVRGAKLARTVRYVAFVNEEPPFFQTEQMGSMVYARRCRERNKRRRQ